MSEWQVTGKVRMTPKMGYDDTVPYIILDLSGGIVCDKYHQ